MKLVKFEKENCGACNRVQSFLDDKGIEAEKVNPFDNPEVAGEYDIGSVPTTILVDDNDEEVQRTIGFNSSELEDIVSKL